MSVGDPPRLVDDPRASMRLREALRRAADAPAATPEPTQALARLRDAARVEPIAAPVAGSAPRASRSFVRSARWWGVVAVGVTVVALLIAGRSRSTSPGSRRASPVPATSPGLARAVPHDLLPAGAPGPADAPPPVAAGAAAVDATDAVGTRVVRRTGAAAAAVRRAAPTPSPDAMRLEMLQLARVRAARERDPAMTLALADQGHRAFRHGIFYEEREALAIGALARLGRAAEVRARAERFLARHPRGPFSEHVRRIAAGRR